MKKVFIALAFAGIGGVAVWQWYDSGINERQVRYERDIAVAEAPTEPPRVVSIDENYSDEIRSWLSIYFREARAAGAPGIQRISAPLPKMLSSSSSMSRSPAA